MRILLGGMILLWFTAWFSVSVVSQFCQRIGERFPRMTAMGLIPLWTFFAPHPSMHDMHLLYRDRMHDGTVRECGFVSTIEARKWHHAVWNPGKFQNKVFYDLVSSLERQVAETNGDPRVVMLTTPYMVMVNLVMHMPRPADSASRQFLVVRDKTFGPDREPEIVFLGEFHPFSDS